jgi:hypothetical protein
LGVCNILLKSEMSGQEAIERAAPHAGDQVGAGHCPRRKQEAGSRKQEAGSRTQEDEGVR